MIALALAALMAAHPLTGLAANHAPAVPAHPLSGLTVNHAPAVPAQPLSSLTVNHAPAVPAHPLSGLTVNHGPAVVAHPLGNFTVNHYNGLRVLPGEIRNTAVVDYAELPTLQGEAGVDTDRSGDASPGERAAYAAATCGALARVQRLAVDGRPVPWRVDAASFDRVPGQGGLSTGRLTCALSAPATVSSTIVFSDGFLPDRIGWREITAIGEGVRLAPSGIAERSVSRELRSYPDDLLADPLDQRSATLRVAGAGAGATAERAPSLPALGIGGPIGEALGAVDRTFTGLIGGSSLTVPLGLLAVLLAVVLGAGHALIPGHGKTVMAAYLAGRRGRPRDAVVVGATVTATHTAGVLAVGLLISAFSTVAGESVLAWLGLASGLLIVLLGTRLLWTAIRTRHRPPGEAAHGHGHGHLTGSHEPGHATWVHGHGHGIGRGDGRGNGHGHLTAGHGHGHGHGAPGRAGLVGLGVAGGLVPSPSALIVLLGAAALGRTWFGVALVAAYGVGMAATLTATGLLLVKLAARLDRLALTRRGLAARVSGLAPVGTATMVVVLGTGLAVRSLAGAL
ncbi:High-affinity nickel-transporter [Sphaerisporangium sp. TRM90804]|uniref:nickel/cobalt transporter n=1 Tax=Sphaerisporangium sp. TRM90804 TaxID=3031113 RepID=UPI00244B20B8|nr:High-affinity nickel-transporter [Sphaerisporangium sp. TRM90804]MDH2430055.1 High-affinity nickel-transporter [Sphaerisporangium sp. TRM90804]